MLAVSKNGMDERISIACVIVTYFPERAKLSQCIAAVKSEIDLLIIVDNTPAVKADEVVNDYNVKTEIIYLYENKGIAAAQNRGIERAIEANATHILLLDQDSIFVEGGVGILIATLQERARAGHLLAACCALPFDSIHVDGFPLILEKSGWPYRVESEFFQEEMKVLHSISSGSLFSVSILREVGLMNEGLFIDYVDIEWCLRAKYFGYDILVVNKARLKHSLGNSLRKISCFGINRYFISYPMERYYYQIRNFIVIAKLKHVTWKWIFWHLPSAMLLKPLLAILLSNERLKITAVLFKGMFHGFSQKLGRYS